MDIPRLGYGHGYHTRHSQTRCEGHRGKLQRENPRLCIRHKIVHAIYACLLFEQGKKERLSFPLLANREMMCEDMETQKV